MKKDGRLVRWINGRIAANTAFLKSSLWAKKYDAPRKPSRKSSPDGVSPKPRPITCFKASSTGATYLRLHAVSIESTTVATLPYTTDSVPPQAADPDAWNAFTLEYETIGAKASAEEIERVTRHNEDVKAKVGRRVGAEDYAWRIWSRRTR